MTLREDGIYRGKYKVHVKKHKKLGRHRTLIKSAVPLINHLLDDQKVSKVELGKIYNAKPDSNHIRGVTHTEVKYGLRLVIADDKVVQVFRVHTLAQQSVGRNIAICN